MRNRHLFMACCWLLFAALGAAGPAAAQQTESRALAATIGTVSGVAAGGYIAVSIIVLESRFGRYIFDIEDVLGWRSAPVLLGGATGLALGAYSPSRLESAIVYGAGGLFAGALVGTGIGSIIWSPPEGRWAGAAIGAGLGIIIGNMYGVLNPLRGGDADADAASAGVPVMLRVTF